MTENTSPADSKSESPACSAVNCLSCFFCRDIETDDDGDSSGVCKRFPAVLSPLGRKAKADFEEGADGQWIGRYEHSICSWVQPQVCEIDWCGEYRKRDQ